MKKQFVKIYFHDTIEKKEEKYVRTKEIYYDERCCH